MSKKLLSLPFENFDWLEGKLLVSTLEQDESSCSSIIYICAHDRKENFIGGFRTDHILGELVLTPMEKDKSAIENMVKINNADSLLKFIDRAKDKKIISNNKNNNFYISFNKINYSIDLHDISKRKQGKKPKNGYKVPLLYGGPVDTLIAVTTSNIVEINDNHGKQKNKRPKLLQIINKIDIHLDIFKFLKILTSDNYEFDQILAIKGLTIWDKEQLEQEIMENKWMIVDPSINEIFPHNMDNSWENMVKKITILDKNLVANYTGNC
jgi:putative AlgH/UPF0301 family transcriptional regulator